MFPDLPAHVQQAVNDKVISAVEQGVRIRRKILGSTVVLIAVAVAVLALFGVSDTGFYVAATMLIGLLAVVYTLCTISASLNSQLDALSCLIVFSAERSTDSERRRE